MESHKNVLATISMKKVVIGDQILLFSIVTIEFVDSHYKAKIISRQ